MKNVLENRSVEWMSALCIGLGQQLHDIGDELDIELIYDEYGA